MTIPDKPTIWRRVVPPPAIVKMAPERKAAFYARMAERGHDEKTVMDVLGGFAELAEEIIGESKWFNRGRKALGLVADLVKALRS